MGRTRAQSPFIAKPPQYTGSRVEYSQGYSTPKYHWTRIFCFYSTAVLRCAHQKTVGKPNKHRKSLYGGLTSTSGLLRISSTLARSPLAAALTSSSLMSPDSCVSNNFFSNWDRRSGQTEGRGNQKGAACKIQRTGGIEDRDLRQHCLQLRGACSYTPPEALLTAEPEGAILVTAAGLYVQDVPQTSTFRSLSE